MARVSAPCIALFVLVAACGTSDDGLGPAGGALSGGASGTTASGGATANRGGGAALGGAGGRATGPRGGSSSTAGTSATGGASGIAGHAAAGNGSSTAGHDAAGNASFSPPTTCAEVHGQVGCCADDGNAYYVTANGIGHDVCDPGTCGWDIQNSYYGCGTDGGSDPEGAVVRACVPDGDVLDEGCDDSGEGGASTGTGGSATGSGGKKNGGGGKGGKGGSGGSTVGSGGNGGQTATCAGTWEAIPALTVDGAAVNVLIAGYGNNQLYVLYERPGDKTYLDIGVYPPGGPWTTLQTSPALLQPDPTGPNQVFPSYGHERLFPTASGLVYLYSETQYFGADAQGSENAVSYDLQSGAWTIVKDLATPSLQNVAEADTGTTRVLAGGFYGVVGGQAQCGGLGSVQILDATTGAAATVKAGPLGNYFAGAHAAIAGGSVLIGGGKLEQDATECQFYDYSGAPANYEAAFLNLTTKAWGPKFDDKSEAVLAVSAGDTAVLIGEQTCIAAENATSLTCFDGLDADPIATRETAFGFDGGAFYYEWGFPRAVILDVVAETWTQLCPLPAPLGSATDEASEPRFSAATGPSSGVLYTSGGGYFVSW